MISLAGGEPLLRHDLPQIVEAIGRYHFPFITTNGWFVTPQVARDLMQAGAWGVSVSIDYADAERHDARRGISGAWKQAWRAVELLDKARIHKFQRVNVIAVLMDDNFQDLERIMAESARRGAYFMVQPYGHLKTGSRAYYHGGQPVSSHLLQLRRKWKNFLSNPYYLGQFDTFLTEGVNHCRAGQAFFNIDSAGEVAICVEHKSRPVGNLYRDPIQNLRRRLQASAKGARCKSCWYNCRGEIESLYRPVSLLASLPTLLFDRGRAISQQTYQAEILDNMRGPKTYNAGLSPSSQKRELITSTTT